VFCAEYAQEEMNELGRSGHTHRMTARSFRRGESLGAGA
jgi:hypothetical protein